MYNENSIPAFTGMTKWRFRDYCTLRNIIYLEDYVELTYVGYEEIERIRELDCMPWNAHIFLPHSPYQYAVYDHAGRIRSYWQQF